MKLHNGFILFRRGSSCLTLMKHLFYHRPTKLWEGNAFSFHRYLSFCLEGSNIYNHYPWYIGPHWTGPHSSVQPAPTSDIWWPRPETCSNLFTWGPHCASNECWHLVAGYWSMYCSRASGTHPTGMLFFFLMPSFCEKGLKNYWRKSIVIDTSTKTSK